MLIFLRAITRCEIREDREPVSEISALELKLDIDELQEFHTMCTWATVRTFISQLTAQLETIRSKIPYCYNSKLKDERKWSDIVAGRNPHVSGNNSTVTHNIATVITSRSSHPSKGAYKMETSKTLHPPTVKKNNRKYQDRRP